MEEQDMDIEAWQRVIRVVGDFRRQGSPLLHLRPYLVRLQAILNNWSAEAGPSRPPQPQELIGRPLIQRGATPTPRAPMASQRPVRWVPSGLQEPPAPRPPIVAQPQEGLVRPPPQGLATAPAGIQ